METSKQMELYEWMCRVRRDILAIEHYLENQCPGSGTKYKKYRKDDLQLDPADPEAGTKQKHSKATAKSEKMSEDLGYADPGDPPLPPFD
jgi:hypothetical protein